MAHGRQTLSTGGFHSFGQRLKGAALLRSGAYEAVEHDRSATTQAALVVALVAVCAAIGGARAGAGGIITGLIAAFLGWLLWSAVTWFIGDKLLGGRATWGELLRTLGFAQIPGVLFIVGVIPVLGAIAILAASIWILVAGVVAIRQALDFGTGRALLTAFIGWLVYLGIALVSRWLLGVGPQVV